MSAPPLEREAVETLTREFSEIVVAHYRRRPMARATAQEVLNAAAAIVGFVIAAARECGAEAGAREFFELALEQQLASEQPTTLGALERKLQ
jgi:hypothetical protein